MNRLVPSLALAVLLVPLTGASAPAEASSRWFVGADFSVGGIGFSLGFADFDRYRRGPSYFYRTGRHLSYRGFRCGSACYIRDNLYYHHPDCPLVHEHFHRYGFNPYSAWAALPYGGFYYAPRPYIPYRPGYSYYRYDPRYEIRRFDDRHGYWDHRRDDDSDSDSDRRWRGDDRRGHGGAARSRSRRHHD
ncbi:MAG: hypothetical protein OES32_00835 [Acidobacteriota bacterium]|nr:hypothetical protein [Acidobacteriota bacterium]MDH3522105.1 hypothetical protein [Acidobacteriota bacterium]